MFNFLFKRKKHNQEALRRENAIAITEKAIQDLYDRIGSMEEPHKTGLGHGMVILHLKHRLRDIQSGYLELGWLDDVFDENGNIRDDFEADDE